jgi:hypothetical protein
MNRLEKVMILVFLSLALGLPLLQALKAQPNIREYGLKGHIQMTQFSPPQSGVSLIEEILWRVRSTPRLAMAVSSTKNQTFVRNYDKDRDEEKQEQSKKGITDYTLAIKPKESLVPIREKAEPTMDMGKLAWKADSRVTNQKTKTASSSGLRADQLASASPAKAKFYNAPRQQQILDDRPAIRDFRAPTIASVSPRTGGSYAGGSSGAVSTALPSPVPMSLPAPIIASKQMAKRAASPQYIAQAPIVANENEAMSDRLVMDDIKGSRQLQQERVRRNALADSEVNAPAAPSVLSESKDSQPLKIAMRPTRMVTGIPQLKLGVSEAESKRSFKAFGNIKKDVISDWTVWTYFRPGVKVPAMQVYVHQGFVEAMRIFDQELISAELGVHLGDDLGTVKEQFGEPAFIIPEPAPGSGHNYIYPLSRVGFHLMRPNANKAPQVVSMLIFHAR